MCNVASSQPYSRVETPNPAVTRAAVEVLSLFRFFIYPSSQSCPVDVKMTASGEVWFT
jgi:hypothetical protein